MPAVSVVVPVYKVEKYLSRCVESILNQPFEDYELILVDDGSPDACGEMCDAYAKKHDHIRVIHKENEGLGYARNSGIEIAKGKYISFIDSDDYIEENLIGELYKEAIRTGADTVIAAHKRETGKSRKIEENIIAGENFAHGQVIEQVLIRMLGPKGDGSDQLNMAAWRVLYSMDLIRNNNLRFPSEREFISEDIIFDLHYYQFSKKVSGIDNAGYIYCVNPNSLTERYNSERYIKGKVLYEEKKRILATLGIYEGEAKYRVEESFLRYSRYAIKSEAKFSKTNGREKSKDNIRSIMKDPVLLQCLSAHENHSEAKRDAMLDFFIKRSMPGIALLMMKLGYLMRR